MPQSKAAERYHFLDGLRGFFSVSVLIFHTIFAFYGPAVVPYTAFGLLFDGINAVHVFFVISGFSLCIGYFRALEEGLENPEGIVRKMAAARYLRLALPSLAASLLMFVIMACGWNFFASMPDEHKIGFWRWAYRAQEVGFLQAVKFALYDVFFPAPFLPTPEYKGVYLITNLWTMSVEFFGSIMVFIYALTIKGNPRRLIISFLAAALLTAAGSYYAFFFAGIIIADLYLKLSAHQLPRWAEVSLGVVAMAMFCFAWPNKHYAEVLLSMALVSAVAIGRYPRALFSSAPFRYLGSISFALYLVHMPVIVSVQSYLYLTYAGSMSQSGIIAFSGGASLVISMIAAHLFAYVDRASIRLSHKVGRLITNS